MDPEPDTDPGNVTTELASRRSGMAFQRTRLSADRTLMAVIRTSLSLIGFGFTISEFFRQLHERGMMESAAPARSFGLALVGLGVAMLTMGIIYHVLFMYGLRMERRALKVEGLIHAKSLFPPSMTFITACILLLIGSTAIIGIIFRIGPFH